MKGPTTPEGKERAMANLIPAKPGEVRNPAGRTSAGAVALEWCNMFAERGTKEKELREIAADKEEPPAKRAAAIRMVRWLENGDLSDFAGLLRGENSLEDLRAMGINTEVVKKFKQKTRRVPAGNNAVDEVIEREIELHDRSGSDFDRILDRTVGHPKQAMEISGRDGGPIKHEYDLSKLSLDELRQLRELRNKIAVGAN